MAANEVRYDQEADALYVQLNDLRSARTTPVDDLRLIDYSADGRVVGVEFLEVSGGIDLSALPFMHRMEELIRDRGLDIRIFA
jgi:uncharacterized protein YuzE